MKAYICIAVVACILLWVYSMLKRVDLRVESLEKKITTEQLDTDDLAFAIEQSQNEMMEKVNERMLLMARRSQSQSQSQSQPKQPSRHPGAPPQPYLPLPRAVQSPLPPQGPSSSQAHLPPQAQLPPQAKLPPQAQLPPQNQAQDHGRFESPTSNLYERTLLSQNDQEDDSQRPTTDAASLDFMEVARSDMDTGESRRPNSNSNPNPSPRVTRRTSSRRTSED